MSRRDEWALRPTYTYFMQVGKTGLVKIGKSIDPFLRRGVLACRVRPEELYVLGVLNGAAHEKRLHRKLREHRAHGEWFHPTPAVLAEIAKSGPIEPPLPRIPSNSWRQHAVSVLLSDEERADIELLFEHDPDRTGYMNIPDMLRSMIVQKAAELRLKIEAEGKVSSTH